MPDATHSQHLDECSFPDVPKMQTVIPLKSRKTEDFPGTRTRCGTRHNSLIARITPFLSESLYEIERRTGRSVRPTVEPSGRKRRRSSRHSVRSLDALPLLRPLALRRAA